jgi:TP901 family phage tail tape measure protein
MGKILEAELRIIGSDRTAAAFAGVIRHARELRQALTGVNRILSPAALSAYGARLDSVGRQMTRFGRNMTYAVTLPVAAAGAAMYSSVREYELAANKLKAFGGLSDEQMKRARQLSQTFGSQYQFGPAGVMKGMVEQIKAGFEPRHLAAIQQPILDFATLAEIEVPRAAELAVFALAGFGKMYDKTGQMLEDAALNKTLRELVDLYAVLNKVAPGSIGQISETFKYSAAAAAQLHISPEQLGAFTAVLAQAGIIGPESGVALRSMMVRFLKPTRPALAAMSAIGMNIDDYIVKNPALLKPQNVLGAVEQQTGTLSPAQRAGFLRRLAGLDAASGEGYEKGLIAAIQSLGTGDLKDADIAGKLATRIMGTAIEKIDIAKFLKDAAGKAPNFAAFMAQFMDQRQAVRLANLDNARVTHMLTELEKELADARERGASVSRNMADEINSGLIRAENRLRGSYQNLIRTVFETGVGDALVNLMNSLAGGIKSLSAVNPKILELSTYALAAAAALGPVAVILGRLAIAAGWILKAAGIASLSASAGVAAGKAGPGAAAIIGGLGALKRDAATGNSLRSQLRALLGIADPNEPAPWLPGGTWNPRADTFGAGGPRALSLEAVRNAVYGGGAPKAELQGHADLTVKVEPSPDFWTRIERTISNTINNLRINGAAPTGTSGATGQAMPEALPAAP